MDNNKEFIQNLNEDNDKIQKEELWDWVTNFLLFSIDSLTFDLLWNTSLD